MIAHQQVFFNYTVQYRHKSYSYKYIRRTEALFSPQKIFSFLSHRILRHMQGALNID
jgi:hypothetical protein